MLDQFQPEVVGISLYTSTILESEQAMSQVAERDIPLVVGGPHATLHAETLAEDSRIDYLVKGEAEGCIADLVASARRQDRPVVIDGAPGDLAHLPLPDFSGFVGQQEIRQYPLQTSRGCPYRCSFCPVRRIVSQRWRPRDPKVCVEELIQARSLLPRLEAVEVCDDCPTGDRHHFKRFLRMYIDARINLPMVVANMRADAVDEELLDLLKDAGCGTVCLGIEHAHPEVFGMINKGETLEQILSAAKLIKGKGLALGACFIIGLPGDTFERIKVSIRLAKKLRLSMIYWNMAHPLPGTPMAEWFATHGATFYPDAGYASYRRHDFRCSPPVVETPDFTREEREAAYFLAVMETDQYFFGRRDIIPLLRLALRHRMLWPALKSLRRRLLSLEGMRRVSRKLRTGLLGLLGPGKRRT